ncbi:MAG TPA: hypothetical protein VGB83_11500 [Actinomycetota bacterium]
MDFIELVAEVLLSALALALLIAIVLGAWRTRKQGKRGPADRTATEPAGERPIERAATRAMRFPEYSLQLVEPHVVRRPAPPPAGLDGELHPVVIPGFEERRRPVPRIPFADSIALSPAIRRAVADPDNPVDVIRAILEHAGLEAKADRDVVRSGDAVFVVVAPWAGHRGLNRAYLRFRGSGAKRGLVVGMSALDPTEVRRREMLEPGLRHAGVEAIQRMAGAAAIGADPLAFALGPGTGRRRTRTG